MVDQWNTSWQWTHFSLVRYEYYKENNIKKVFENVEIKIISHLKAVNKYIKSIKLKLQNTTIYKVYIYEEK